MVYAFQPALRILVFKTLIRQVEKYRASINCQLLDGQKALFTNVPVFWENVIVPLWEQQKASTVLIIAHNSCLKRLRELFISQHYRVVGSAMGRWYQRSNGN